MAERGDNTNITDKIAQYCIVNEIKYSNRAISFINTRIKLYSTLLEHLEDSKPLFFQKKKLIEYNNKVMKYNDKLEELYIELNNEVSSMNQMYNNI